MPAFGLAETVPQDMIAVPFERHAALRRRRQSRLFRRHNPKPRTPDDLRAHRCIRTRMPSGAIYQWEFERRGEAVRIDVKGSLTLDEPGLMHGGRARRASVWRI